MIEEGWRSPSKVGYNGHAIWQFDMDIDQSNTASETMETLKRDDDYNTKVNTCTH